MSAPPFALELADQENKAADALRKRPVRLADLDDAFIDFAQQHASIDHFRGERLEKFVARHDRAKGLVGDFLDGVVNDPKLRAQLAVGARRIDLPEAVFPEPPAYRQQRIVLDDDGAIFDDFANARALQLPRDFTGVRVEKLANVGH